MKTTVSLAALAAVALAAPQALAQSAPQDWSGPYAAIYGGGTILDEDENEQLVFDRDFDGDYDDTVVTSGGANAFGPGSCDGQANGPTPGAGCDDDDGGAEAGGRIGWDFAFGAFVVGALAEYGAVDADDAVTSFSTTPAFYTSDRKLERLGAVRLRGGYAFGPNLIYATGGVARGEIENRFFTSNGANTFTPIVDDDEADGWQAGVGWERQLGRGLTFGAEYLYTSLEAGDYDIRVGPGTAGPTNPFILPPNTAGTNLRRSNPDFEMHHIRLSMGYRF